MALGLLVEVAVVLAPPAPGAPGKLLGGKKRGQHLKGDKQAADLQRTAGRSAPSSNTIRWRSSGSKRSTRAKSER